MARVDRNILRLAAYEMLFLEEIPYNVSMNEAIEIAKRFGSPESPTFVNGVLDKLAHSLSSFPPEFAGELANSLAEVHRKKTAVNQ
jgi:transcription antitermination protein NusB